MTLKKTAGFWPVFAALVGNAFVTVIKFAAAFLSGSSVLFSEAIHSFADTANQSLLIIGLRRSVKKPDEEYIYGYGRERFFWALISACGIFFLGAGVTIYRGVNALLAPIEISLTSIVFYVLILSFIIESITLAVAIRELNRKHRRCDFLTKLQRCDPSTMAVLLEDSVAILGVIIAFASVLLVHLTRQLYWDAVGSILIGILLGFVAIVLIVKNRSYLIGRTIPPNLQEKIIEKLEADPAIEKVVSFKSTVLDMGVYRITCDIEFNGNFLMKEIFEKMDLREQFEEVRGDYEEFKKFCVDFADRIPRLVGRRIDHIEKEIHKEVPSVKYIDIEIN